MRIASIAVRVWCFLGGPAVGIALAQQSAPAPAGSEWTPDQPLTGHALACDKGRIKIFDCSNVELLAYLPPSAMGGGPDVLGPELGPNLGGAGGVDIWGWTDSTSGREFAVVGGSDGTSFVEVTDPVNPKYLGKLPFHKNLQGLAGVKVYKNYAFIVVEGANAGLQVFDLTQLRAITNAPATFQETAHYDNFGNAHTIALNPETGFAYTMGSFNDMTIGSVSFESTEPCSGGLHMIDVRTPAKPTFAGCFADMSMGSPMAGYVHDAQCVVYHGPDQQHQGREICLYATGSGLGIVDVTDKKKPIRISTVTYPDVGYTHQGWFTPDQRYFFVDDEGDDGAGGINKTRTIVFDMKDLDDPVVATQFYGTTDAGDHNLYINGRYMYQSNFSAGLRIVDVADPEHAKEVGYLDTAPNLDGPGIKLGSWGNYPYFKNGVVAVASRGLFLVRLKS